MYIKSESLCQTSSPSLGARTSVNLFCCEFGSFPKLFSARKFIFKILFFTFLYDIVMIIIWLVRHTQNVLCFWRTARLPLNGPAHSHGWTYHSWYSHWLHSHKALGGNSPWNSRTGSNQWPLTLDSNALTTAPQGNPSPICQDGTRDLLDPGPHRCLVRSWIHNDSIQIPVWQ